MTSELPKDAILIPDLCYNHRYDFHRVRLRTRQNHDPWMAIELTLNILLFQASTVEIRPPEGCQDEQAYLRDFIAKIGCLACHWPDAYFLACKIMKAKGWEFAAQLSQMKVTHDMWPPKSRTGN